MPFIEISQFNVYPKPMQLFPTVRPMKMPLFSNNAQVYYKPGSLSSGGVGTVRNSRRKGKHT